MCIFVKIIAIFCEEKNTMNSQEHYERNVSTKKVRKFIEKNNTMTDFIIGIVLNRDWFWTN